MPSYLAAFGHAHPRPSIWFAAGLGVVFLGTNVARARDSGRVLVIADDFSEEGGIRSRVFGELYTIGADEEVSLVTKVRARNLRLMHKSRSEFETAFPHVKLRQIPVLPHGGLPVLAELLTSVNVLILAGACLITRSSRRIKSLYAHNSECILAAIILGRLLRVRVTADIHGDEVEENIAVNGWNRGGIRHRFWRWLEGVVTRTPDLAVCVSSAHQEHVTKEYGRRGPTVVIPCCVGQQSIAGSADRLEDVASLGLPSDGHIWLLYSGSSSKWQMLDAMAAFHRSLTGQDMKANFLLLIADPKSIPSVKGLFRESPSGSVVVLSVPHAEVARLSRVAHAALLFREDVPLNRISSPTKFAEYLASGLPVIITPSVGDYSKATSDHKLGQVVELARVADPAYTVSVMNKILTDGGIRSRCLDFVKGNLTWGSYRTALLQAYGFDGEGGR